MLLSLALFHAIYGIGSPDDYRDKVIHLKKGMNIDRKKLLKELVNIHYSRNDSSFERSNFRVRGDVVDIFLAYEDVGVRLEFFGSELENLQILSSYWRDNYRP